MKLGNLEIMGDLVLAPMAGVTDLAFRTICAELGAAVTVTEMVSSRALIYQDKKSRSLLHKTPLGVCGAQIFGMGQPMLISIKSAPDASSASAAPSAMTDGSLPKICAPQTPSGVLCSRLLLFLS